MVCSRGLTIAEAIRQAMRNTELKEKYFIALFTYHAQPPALNYAAHAVPLATHNKGKGKGKQIRSLAPDGRNICFEFNNKNETCDGACGMAHICQRGIGQSDRPGEGSDECIEEGPLLPSPPSDSEAIQQAQMRIGKGASPGVLDPATLSGWGDLAATSGWLSRLPCS
eukprot:6483267-Amphidinium_carterae.1